MSNVDAWPEGRTIVKIRPATDKDLELHGFEFNIPNRYNGLVLVLDDDTTLIPSMDEEGNGCGVLFGSPNNNSMQVSAEWVLSDE